MKSEQYFKRSLEIVPGGVHSPVRSFKGLHTTPIFIKEANGAKIYDEDGCEYIDFCMSFGPLILGHNHPSVREEILKAIHRGWSYGACERYSLELAEYIVAKIPYIDQIRFMNSGTEAVMTALRIARGFTGKDKILKLDGCYHGHLDSMLIKSGSGLAGTAEASSKGVTAHTAADTLVCPMNDQEALEQCFRDYQGEIAAIILEPLPANYGLLPLSGEYLQFLRKITTDNQALLIFDEVISGFRTSFGGMSEVTGIIPDIVTYGKIIGGGMPVGAVAGKKEIMSSLAPIGPVYQAGTLSANPVAMVAGLSTLKLLTPDFYQNLAQKTKNITNCFSSWMSSNGFEDYSFIQYQSLFWPTPTKKAIKKVEDYPTNIAERFRMLFEQLLKRGIYLSPNGYEIAFVSSAHDESVVTELEQRLCN